MDAMLTEALGHHQSGRPREAEALYRQILEVNPDHSEALHLLGVLALQADHGDEAIRLMERSLELNPSNASALNNLGQAFESLGRLDDAMAVYRKAIAVVPDFVEAQSNLGDALMVEGKPEEAIACYESVLKSHPDEPEALNTLGTALASLGKQKDAIAHFRHALEIAPEDPVILTNLGNALQADGKPEEAVHAFKRALATDPDFVEAQYNLGVAYHDQNQPEDALASYYKAISLNPDYAEAHLTLGLALQELGRPEEAMASLDQALFLLPDYVKITWPNVIREHNSRRKFTYLTDAEIKARDQGTSQFKDVDYTVTFSSKPKTLKLCFDIAEITHKYIYSSLVYNGCYEEPTFKFMTQVLGEGDHFVDVGAHIGIFSLVAASAVEKTGSVIAIEPIEENYNKLTKHIQLNNFDNIHAIKAIISSEDGESSIYFNPHKDGSHSIWDPSNDPNYDTSKGNPTLRSSKSFRLDTLLNSHSVKSVKIVKIDAEGSEYIILNSCENLIRENTVEFFICEINEFALRAVASSGEELMNFMRKLGYHTYLPVRTNDVPVLVPPRTAIDAENIYNVVFSKLDSISKYWPKQVQDPTQPPNFGQRINLKPSDEN